MSTRQEIELQSGLGRAVVADRIATLIGHGLVDDDELGISTGGRAPRQVRFTSTAGHLLVASIGTTTLGVALTDLSGRLLAEHHEAGDIGAGAQRTLDRLDALFDWMLEEHPQAAGLWGIGLAVPGPVGRTEGSRGSKPVLHLLPGWADFPITDHLRQRYGVPAWVGNEAHLMALGELHAGRGAGRDDLLFLKLGTGISAALCANGRIYRGSQGYAGDVGHVTVHEDSQVICRCGNRGCLEALAGGTAIAREGQEAAEDGRSPYLADLRAAGRIISAADVGMAAARGDAFSIELLTRCGRLIGGVLATLVNGFNPSLVVVGGGVADAGEILLAAIREALFRRSRSLATQDVHIVRAELGKTAALTGAALNVVDELFAWDYLRTWIDHGTPVRSPEAARIRGTRVRPTSGRQARTDAPVSTASGARGSAS